MKELTANQALELVRLNRAVERLWRRVLRFDKATGRCNQALGGLEDAWRVTSAEVDKAKAGDLETAWVSFRTQTRQEKERAKILGSDLPLEQKVDALIANEENTEGTNKQ